MYVFDYEKEKTPVVAAKLQELQQDVEIGVAQAAAAPANLRYLGVIDYGCVVALAVFIDDDGAVNPHRKFVEKIPLRPLQILVAVGVEHIFGTVFAKHKFLAANVFRNKT